MAVNFIDSFFSISGTESIVEHRLIVTDGAFSRLKVFFDSILLPVTISEGCVI